MIILRAAYPRHLPKAVTYRLTFGAFCLLLASCGYSKPSFCSDSPPLCPRMKKLGYFYYPTFTERFLCASYCAELFTRVISIEPLLNILSGGYYFSVLWKRKQRLREAACTLVTESASDISDTRLPSDCVALAPFISPAWMIPEAPPGSKQLFFLKHLYHLAPDRGTTDCTNP